MDLERTRNEPPINPEWMELMDSGIDQALMMYLEGEIPAVNISPDANSFGEDERTFQDLSPTEQRFIIKLLFDKLDFKLEEATVETSYPFEIPQPNPMDTTLTSFAQVSVYETPRSLEENIYLHEIKYPDEKLDYIVAPKDFTL